MTASVIEFSHVVPEKSVSPVQSEKKKSGELRLGARSLALVMTVSYRGKDGQIGFAKPPASS
jgi:hypothetical protein